MLAAWSQPTKLTETAFLEVADERREDRTAVPLAYWRRARCTLRADLERMRRRDGRLDARRSFRRLRAVVLHELVGAIGARIGEIAQICPADYEAWHDFEDGVYAPAIRIAQSKRRRTSKKRVPIWHPLDATTASYVEEWLTLAGLDPKDAQLSIWSRCRAPRSV